MKQVDQKFRVLAPGLWAGLAVCLLAGCASPATSNRKVYDRYAELVAARNRSISEETSAPPPAARMESSKPATVAERPPAKPVPVKPASPVEPEAPAQPVSAPPVQVMPPPSAEKLAAVVPVVVPAPAPVPATPAPVEQPAPPPTPVPAVPAAVPAPAPAPAASPAIDARPSASSAVAYLLKVGDFVQITLRGIPSGDTIEDVIDEDGMVTLPLINEVQAAGATPSELERNIRKIYQDQDIYRNITVTVVVPTRYYFVQGEVRSAGKFQILSATRVSQAIAGAGGYNEYASGRVLIKRGGKIFQDIRNARRLERTPEDDILLEPDDIVEVKRSLW